METIWDAPDSNTQNYEWLEAEFHQSKSHIIEDGYSNITVKSNDLQS